MTVSGPSWIPCHGSPREVDELVTLVELSSATRLGSPFGCSFAWKERSFFLSERSLSFD